MGELMLLRVASLRETEKKPPANEAAIWTREEHADPAGGRFGHLLKRILRNRATTQRIL